MEKVELEFGAWGTRLLRLRQAGARLDAVRPGAGVPARGGAARRAAVGRLDPRHVRVPRRPVEPMGAAVALPRRDRRGARPRRGRASRRSRTAIRRASRAYERFRVHRTVFPQDFLADFGFQVVRSAGRVGLSRLELGGLQPVEEGKREKVLAVVRSAFGVPEREPVPAPRP